MTGCTMYFSSIDARIADARRPASMSLLIANKWVLASFEAVSADAVEVRRVL